MPHPIVVENRAGGNGVIGTEAMVRAEADGHTLIAVVSTHILNRHTMAAVSGLGTGASGMWFPSSPSLLQGGGGRNILSMTMPRRALLAAPLALPARAQPAWPARPVRRIIPYAAGGGTDI